MKKFTKKITPGNLNYSIITLMISCEFCNEEFSDVVNKYKKISLQNQFARSLENSGWKMLDSEENIQLGIACPNCILVEANYRGVL